MLSEPLGEEGLGLFQCLYTPLDIISMKRKNTTLLFIGLFFFCLWSLLGCSDEIEVSVADAVSVKEAESMPLVKVFLENSGSMDGFMCEGSDLKNALFSYLSDLEQSGTKVEKYYINSEEIPFDMDIEQYIRDLSPESFRQAGGNRANSDILQLLDSMVSKVNSSCVSIFVSDCILDLPATDSQKYLTTGQISMRNALSRGRKKIPNLGVQILQMFSEFAGKYYYPQGGIEFLNGVRRPYYIWLFGSTDQLAKMRREVPFESLENYGLKEMVTFVPETKCAYTIINARGSDNVKKIVAQNHTYSFSFKVDLSRTLQDDKSIGNSSNYTLNREKMCEADISFIELDTPLRQPTLSIYPIPQKEAFTHTLKLAFPMRSLSRGQKLTIAFHVANKIPSWVELSNDDHGEDIHQNLFKTTGIKYLITGVAEAYSDVKTWCEFQFNVKQ